MATTGTSVLRVVVACDPGLDDALALVWLLGRPDVQVDALVAVAGNVSAEVSARNARCVLAAAGRPDIPTYATTGIDQPYADLPSVMGVDGLGGLAEALGGEAHTGTRDLAELRTTGSHLLALGPATVPAALLQRHVFTGVTWMGGVFHARGNSPDGGECNASADLPAAAALVAGAPSLRIIPLDATRHLWFTAHPPTRNHDVLFEDSPFSTFARRYCDLARDRGRDRAFPHDLVAAATLLIPEAVRWQNGAVDVAAGRFSLAPAGSTRVALGWRWPTGRLVEAMRPPAGVASGPHPT